jgi:adenosylcobalamin-dependent ribonucleoside-triphosphate reductase
MSLINSKKSTWRVEEKILDLVVILLNTNDTTHNLQERFMEEKNSKVKSYTPGMGQAVADRTINRKKADGTLEKWGDVAFRVARGNTNLFPADSKTEFNKMYHHLKTATLLMSGRHLQHGDERQPERNMEVFTNCATSATSFLTFYLLLNGSGVGRCMDDDMMLVDYNNLPIIVPVIDSSQPDVLSGEISERLDKRSAEHLYRNKVIRAFEVEDSREGWARAIEKIEVMAFQKIHRESVLLIDFSPVRHRGSPIHGMQERPASGPGPLILALEKIAKIRDAEMQPWRATMFVDHYLAECVLVGGARRAARMATKTWRDKSVFDFINLKRGGFLWSSNNSVTVDEEFWKEIHHANSHAKEVFEAITSAAYFDKTGEPGIINQDKLTQKGDGTENYLDGRFAESKKLKLDNETIELTKQLALAASKKQYHQITNPCGEITLNMIGGYCVIADVVPYHAASDEEALDAFKTATRALMRVNLMDSMYKKEVERTNRIGVGITGFHEWAWKRFQFGWKDIIDEEKSKEMWLMLSRFKRAVADEAAAYSKILGTKVPHTDTTIKPAGTTSKLFGLTEGAHLPTMREFLRWVQFRSDDPIVEDYRRRGYPVKVLRTYSGTTVVGFPTQPEICKLGMGDKLVTATEATPEEQFQYLRLLEKYWIRGVQEDGITPLEESGNQISYTLKYDPKNISFEEFQKTIIDEQSSVRCCSVMPQTDISAYEYQPEEAMTSSRYQQIMNEIQNETSNEEQKESVDFIHVDCSTNACPVDFH